VGGAEEGVTFSAARKICVIKLELQPLNHKKLIEMDIFLWKTFKQKSLQRYFARHFLLLNKNILLSHSGRLKSKISSH
jgi:hypothetical protein